MSFPTTAPVLTQEQSIVAITEAEAGIAQCMQEFLCSALTNIDALPHATAAQIDDQVDLVNKLLCAYTCKEKGIAAVLDGLANKILADKGLVPGGDGGGTGNGCKCDC